MSHHQEMRLSTSQLVRSLMEAMCASAGGRVYGKKVCLDHRTACAIAQSVARALSGIGGAPVAICTQKSPEAIAAILGILESGRAYAPLDPSHPVVRLETILERLSPSALIVDGSTKHRLAALIENTGVPVFLLESMGTQSTGHALELDCTLAAVLHTSGSTGVPKRALIGATAIHVFAGWVRDEFNLGPNDRVLSHAPLAFDLSFLDIFASLSAGASIILADADEARSGERLARIIDEHQVTFLHAAPSALSLLVQAAKDRVFASVRAVLFAGEPMPAGTLNLLMGVFPEARFTNIYGCTETNDTFFYHVPRGGAPDPLPLGRPLPYAKYRVLDQDRLPVLAMEEGILWVACPTMMDGYSDAALTRDVFAEFDGVTYYRTNDRVRHDDDGLLRFLGRADSVKKINGYRVDLSEVESCLSKIDGVREAAVFEGHSHDGSYIAAAISAGDAAVTALSVRMQAMQMLPPYAIPKQFMITPEPLPKNSNGKICRRTLASAASA